MHRLLLSFALAATVANPATAAPPLQLSEITTSWTDDDGHSVALANYGGTEPVFVVPFFTSCPTRCPRTVTKLKAIDAAYARAGKEAQFVLITLDPDKDTAERLHAYRLEAKLSPKNWHLLTGTKAETHAIAMRLGVRPIYDDTHIIHDIRTFLFDAHGTWLKTLNGFSYDTADALVP